MEDFGTLGVSLSYGSCSPATSEGRGHEEVGVSETPAVWPRRGGFVGTQASGAVLCGAEFGEESGALVLVG